MIFRYSYRKAKLFANSGDPDQTPRSAASDLGLHCLPITRLGVSRLQWVNLISARLVCAEPQRRPKSVCICQEKNDLFLNLRSICGTQSSARYFTVSGHL